ncbi:PQQ-like beta-propeller repeat protein [soil metagenome]
MSLKRPIAYGVVAAAALAMAGCSTVSKINPFKKNTVDDIRGAEKAKRVPVLALDEALRPADELKGIQFFLPSAKAQADWPLPGGTAEQSVEHVDAAPAFQVAWRRRFGQKSTHDAQVTAPPVAFGGRIFVMDGEAQVSALDGASGRQVWRVNLNPKLRRDRHAFGGGLAIADGKLFVTSGFRFVAALDVGTGALLWKEKTSAPIHNAPTVSGGRVFATTTDNELDTFDAASGRPGWKYQALVEPARILQASSPAVSGDTVVASFSSGELVALSAANGTELWNQQLTRASRTTALSEIRDIPGRPVIYRGDVLAGSHSGVFASVDIRTGQMRWQPLAIATLDSAWAAGDVVFITSKAGEVICASRDTGQVYWIRDLNAGRKQVRQTRWFGFTKVDRPYWTGVVYAGNRLISVSSEGNAASIDPRTGALLSTIKLGAPGLIAPIAVNGMVYVVTDDAELVAIR